jgi:CheY-like chemotaxis protein
LGYEVVSTNDGVEALKIPKRSEHFDMLFTDVVMPRGINGCQLADEVAKLRPELPVLFTSGYAESALCFGRWGLKSGQCVAWSPSPSV